VGGVQLVTTPVWLGAGSAASLQPPTAAQVNQFLVTHLFQNIYPATLQASVTTNGSAHTSGNATTYIAQSFTTGASQTTIGYIQAPIGSFIAAGAALGPATVNLYTNVAGAPGVSLLSTPITTEYVFSITAGVDTVYVTYPLPITGLTAATTYWIVLTPAGNNTNHYTWRQSASASGASTSTNGTSWTAQAYGLQYKVFDGVPAGSNVLLTWEDSGARWTWANRDSDNRISQYAEYTTAQGTGQYVQSFRTLSYSGSLLTGVS
jgi:hypothetical protein